MEYPDQLKTTVLTGRPGVDALDDFLWETASWDPAVELLLEQARRDGADQGPAAAARQLLDEPLVAEPGMVYRLVRLLAEAGELNTDNLAAPRCGPPGGTRPGASGDPLGAALPLVGRETELSRGCRGATRRGAGVSVLCITGATGMGKTRLARAIATAIGRRAPVDHQLEVSLSSAATGPGNRRLSRSAYDALAELLAQLRVREADIPATFAGRRARYAAELAGRRAVILLDGVIDESQVLPLLPPRKGSVVVTGRAPLTGLNDWGAEPLPLGPLSQIESRVLIRHVLATFGIESDDRATDALYEWCAGVPGPTILASRWLATATRTERLPLETLIERMLDARHDEAVTAAVLGLLGEDQQAAVRALGLLQIPEADIWTVCLSTGLSQGRAQAALEQLTDMGLVGHGECNQTWVIAPLVADCARTQAQGQLPEPEFERMLGPVIGLYGSRTENLRDLISVSLPESLSPLQAWAEERWRAERASVGAVLVAAADSENPALTRGLATAFTDLADHYEEHGSGWRATEASAAAVIRIASDASDHELQARALRSLERQTQLQGEAAHEPAPELAGLAVPPPVTVPRNGLARLTEAVRRDLIEIPGAPLLFGGPGGESTPARIERFIEGRCQERVKVGQPSWIAVQISVRAPKHGGALLVDLPAAGTRVHAMLQTSSGLRLESEPDLELLVPPDRDTGWHAWQVRPMSSGTHQAVACFHHDGEVLAALGFTLRAGQIYGSDQRSASENIDLRPLTLRQGLLVVCRAEGMLRFIGLDGAKQGEGITAVAQKVFQPKDVKLLDRWKKQLDLIARASRTGHSRAADSDSVHAMGLDLFDFLPDEIQDFLVSGLGRWQSLKIEADDESLPWELLAQRRKGTETFFANQLPFLRWRLGLPPPGTSIACETAILVPGQEIGRADTDTDSFEQQIEALRSRLHASPKAVVRNTRDLRRQIRAGDFDLLHYCGHMSADEDGSPSMHVGNDSFNVSGISPLPPNALTRRPLVFLNACTTNKTIRRLTGPTGWVQDFLAKGAGSFVGTNWTVRASTAAKFAEHFYTALLGSGQSNLAAASALARQQTAEEEGVDWVSLAYTIYGHPEARIQARNHGDADVQTHDD